MSDKSELKAELERKKQRLAQIREEKKRKEEERKKKETDQKKEAAVSVQEESDLEKKRREAEALLQSMGLTTDSPIVFSEHWVPPPMSPSSKSVSTPSEAGSQDSGDGAVGSRTLHWDTDPSALQLHSDSDLGRGPIKLGMAKITQVDFPPREIVTYTKETQTPVTAQPKEDEEEEDDVAAPKPPVEPEEEKILKKDEENDSKAPPHELTEEEKQQILHSEEFLSFFDHSTRIVERALSEQINIFFDYSGRDLEDKEGEIQAGAKLSLNRQFFDERWSKHRVVSCLDWSSQYPELLVASYNNNEEAPHEPDGVALVWNMKYKKTTPEYVFHCQSAVMSATFAKFHPNLVVGGTYSGQIVLWDNRSNKRTPVQRTPLSAAAHTHPVYCVNVVGTQNAHNLISISTDGKICSWSLDMLSHPQDSMELVHKQSKAVAVTSMSFPVGDVNNFVVGSEEGSVYTACRHGSKAGISEMFEGHQGPITGIHCHAAVGAVDFSHLFVTSSFDWTVKLWTTKNNKPLYSFEDNSDYVYDVMWSPTHPALFACVDGMGRLDLWNLNNDTEVPTASISVEGNPALNRVRWTHSGREIAVGDSEGQIVIYDVGEQIAVPRNDEWARFGRTLAEINASRADAEEEAATRIPA
ncbi:dynein, cytoplasmic, intermediate chain 2, isoform CRA_a [Rattus norvegicus]|uniref:Cytoplasmic dynein 1 intermediate chain 2 n=2 Tax=Rattus norvegicus TaxID=10116 RepID=A0ABZ3NN81_RAT|nr:cytoplasmic dynein 1 intermediate chain 2 isoform 1 [Rattus norvegicus]XP_017446921.1 cytoplasmic dynein 1 intermediate chain 2 isoform X1 [Rattus norvegicus]XP_038960043.1 cytoplasmic dynein 1 intermediate chain 2 isoform X1 [Rattus norvegicus]EDL79094.1 dynein, cytoplasmic, intermediate chain 2, isoform CRA_a [Rattus norvegicus]|eukprot:NP_446332.2 cytoplasmic dynein 1 intermediate chain 2 isoform 1 [Rattus norvegicus]